MSSNLYSIFEAFVHEIKVHELVLWYYVNAKFWISEDFGFCNFRLGMFSLYFPHGQFINIIL